MVAISVARSAASEGPRRGCGLLLELGGVEALDETPAGNHRIARGGAEIAPASAAGRRRTGPDRDPAVSRWQPRRPAALTARAHRRRGRTCAPLRRRWRGRRRQQGAVTPRAPDPLPVPHVPPRPAAGTHLDHRTSLATVAQTVPTPPSSVTTGVPHRPSLHAAADVDRGIAVLREKLGHPLGSTTEMADHEQLRAPGRSRRRGRAPRSSGCAVPPAAWPRCHSSFSLTSSRTTDWSNVIGISDTSSLPELPRSSMPHATRRIESTHVNQQCGAIHSFHRFIHRPPSAESRYELLNLCNSLAFLWITWRRYRTVINRLAIVSEIGWRSNVRCEPTRGAINEGMDMRFG